MTWGVDRGAGVGDKGARGVDGGVGVGDKGVEAGVGDRGGRGDILGASAW